MSTPISGAMTSPRPHTASDDDVTDCANAVEYAAQSMEEAFSALTRAHKLCDDYMNYGAVGRIRDGMPLRKAQADLLSIMNWLRMGAKD